MNQTAKRNHYRGLSRYVAETYGDALDTVDPAVLCKTLQGVEKWKGVSLASVEAAVNYVRRFNLAAAPAPARKRRKTTRVKLPDVLVTLPLPKKGSVTMTVSEAAVLHGILSKLFANTGA